MGCSPLGSSVHGILQTRTLEWVAMPSSRGSSQPRDWTWVFHVAGRFFIVWPTREAPELLGCSFIWGEDLILTSQEYNNHNPITNLSLVGATEDRRSVTSGVVQMALLLGTPFLLPSSCALPWRGVWGEHVESCSTPGGLRVFLCGPRTLTSPAGRLEQPGLIPVAYWLCDHCLFPHPWNEGMGFWHSRDSYQPISTLSSQLFPAQGRFCASFRHPFLLSAHPPYSPKCPAFCSTLPAFTDLLKLQSSIEVTSVEFLCTVYLLPRTRGQARECIWVYIIAHLVTMQCPFSWGPFKQKTPLYEILSLFIPPFLGRRVPYILSKFRGIRKSRITPVFNWIVACCQVRLV